MILKNFMRRIGFVTFLILTIFGLIYVFIHVFQVNYRICRCF